MNLLFKTSRVSHVKNVADPTLYYEQQKYF